MTTINTSATEVSFRVRPLGFDRNEVQAFIGNLLNDYAQVTHELERMRAEVNTLRDAQARRESQPPPPVAAPPQERKLLPDSTAREVERILEGAERIAEEVRTRAHTDAAAALREAETKSAMLMRDADTKSAVLMRDAESKCAALLKEAEGRATEVVDEAMRQVVHLDRQAAAVRAQCGQMRTFLRSAADAAAAALREINAFDEEREPAAAQPGRP
jgi:cell division septum initiation protein DivIVA